MCRHLGYVGPAVTVDQPITVGEHSLRTQSWAPRDMRGGGTINADGFGVAWWSGGAESSKTVHRYRNQMPIWTDPAVDDVLSQISSTAVLGAVRSATVGMPIGRDANAPFTGDGWAFSHNGTVPRWRETLTTVAADYPKCSLLDLEAATDSAALWLLLRSALDTDDAATALADLVGRIVVIAPDARLNLLLSDGEQIWATTYYHSLFVREGDGSVYVSSEPFDDDSTWQTVPDKQLVTARPGHVSIEPLMSTHRGER